ncbi:MAG: hypothetical protein LBQ88_23475 [Treponema sp.]|nr:hypothetical protein [Treponema sp.]
MEKKRVFCLLLTALMITALITGCVTVGGSGSPDGQKLNWDSDQDGNLKVENISGLDADVYIQSAYVRSVKSGGNVLINVPGTQASGSQRDVAVYKRAENTDLDTPPDAAALNAFSVSLRPAGSGEKTKIIRIPRPEQGDTQLNVSSGSRDLLVEFSYPFEITTFGSVSAQIIKGQINTGTELGSLDHSDDPVSIPMRAGFNQFTIVYTVVNNGKFRRFYFPDWENPVQRDRANTIFLGMDIKQQYFIPPISNIARVSWVGAEDDYATLKIQNKTGKGIQLIVEDQGVNGRRGSIEDFAVGTFVGADTLQADGSRRFRMNPGSFKLTATDVTSHQSVADVPEVILDAGTNYTWIITLGSSSTLTPETNIRTDLSSLIQRWTITSEPEGAKILLSVESTDSSVGTFRDKDLGNTGAGGVLTHRVSIADFIPDITYGNASKVLVKIRAEKDGYIPVTQAINAKTLIDSGSDFKLDEFKLPRMADQNTAKSWVIEDVNWIPIE